MEKKSSSLHKKAYLRAIKYLTLRPRSEQEIENYLTKKGFSDQISEDTIEKLKNDKFLDNLEFCRWWIEGRQRMGKGLYVVRGELRMKGIENEMIERSISEFARDEIEVASEVLEKYSKKFENLSKIKFRQKAGAFLSRRGFPIDIVRKLVY